MIFRYISYLYIKKMSNIRANTTTGILIFFSIILICLSAWCCWQVRIIFVYLIVAAVLTIITSPLYKTLEKIKIRKRTLPRALRAVIVLLTIYILLFTIVAIFIPLVIDQTKNIAAVDSKQVTTAFHEPIAQVQNIFSNVQQSTGGNESLDKYIQITANKILNFTQLSSIANSFFAFLGSALIAFFVISFFTFFFITDGTKISETLLLLVPTVHLKSIKNIFKESIIMLNKYFIGILLDVMFVTTFVSVGLAIAGIQHAFVIGLFAGVMNIIPYVGPLIGVTFGILVGVSSNLTLDFYNGLLPIIEKIILVFALMNLSDAFFIQPYIFSKRVKAHPIEIFLVILIAGTIAGIPGMIIAVPVYTIARIIAKEFLSNHLFVKRLTDDLDKVSDPEQEN
jgi:predicted PurR-regulated permease PerM